jgi:hypothetical protein
MIFLNTKTMTKQKMKILPKTVHPPTALFLVVCPFMVVRPIINRQTTGNRAVGGRAGIVQMSLQYSLAMKLPNRTLVEISTIPTATQRQ